MSHGSPKIKYGPAQQRDVVRSLGLGGGNPPPGAFTPCRGWSTDGSKMVQRASFHGSRIAARGCHRRPTGRPWGAYGLLKGVPWASHGLSIHRPPAAFDDKAPWPMGRPFPAIWMSDGMGIPCGSMRVSHGQYQCFCTRPPSMESLPIDSLRPSVPLYLQLCTPPMTTTNFPLVLPAGMGPTKWRRS